MKKTPKKNINPILADIRHPSKEPRVSGPKKKKSLESLFDKKETPKITIKKRRLAPVVKKTAAVLAIFLFLFVSGYGIILFEFKGQVLGSVSAILDDFKSASTAFKELRTKEAYESLKQVKQELNSLGKEADKRKIFNLASILSTFVPTLSEVPAAFHNIQQLSEVALNISTDLDILKSRGFHLVMNGGGPEIIRVLENLDQNLTLLSGKLAELRNQSLSIEELLPSEVTLLNKNFEKDYLTLSAQLYGSQEALEALINLLKSLGDKHLVIFFENPSEIRPGGGFIGSYADIRLRTASIVSIEVNDIYDPDGQLETKTIPPEPLQLITTNWGARDANWFFDFPKSAERVLTFLETSKLYSNSGTKFEGVIAINVKTIEGILEIIGPIEIEEYELVLNHENFLEEIQREVETGEDKSNGEPKRILKALAPLLIERLGNLSDEGQRKVFTHLQNEIRNKNMRFYFREPKLQKFIQNIKGDGAVYELPQPFPGDYLAVVNANIGGGKTDAVIEQAIELRSQLTESGIIKNNLSVFRRHTGDEREESWYRITNQNFIKIFTPLDTGLTILEGNTVKTIEPPINYEKRGYSIDEEVRKIEDSKTFSNELGAYLQKEEGKNVFAAWFNTPAGKTRELQVSYESSERVKVAPGAKYRFVFDKQAGVESAFGYFLEAPKGYKWLESNSRLLKFDTLSLPARLIIDATLVKVDE